jgi:O-antigen ligase
MPLIAVVALATFAGLVAGEGNVAFTLAPILLTTVLFLLVKLPLRWSATVLGFLLAALELKSDAEGIWATPLVHLGELLYFGLGQITRVNMAGFEVLVVFICGVALWRARSGRSAVHMPVPSITRDVLVLYVGGVLMAEALSLAKGLGPVPWKVRYLLHGPLFFLLFQNAYRHPADFRPLAVAIVAAAHVKALLAAWVQLVVAPTLTGGKLATATNHGDSVLFAMAVLVVIVPALEKLNRRTVLRAVFLLILPVWGIVLNDRRLAWAMLAMSLFAIFCISPWRPWKRKLVRGLLIGAPIVAAYVWVGWNHSSSGLFAPVAKIKSMIDSKNPSTYWRDVETWNIAMSIQRSPITGVGLGGEYVEHMFNDDISSIYPDYRAWPHNTILGLLLLTGVFGFWAIWLLYPFVVFLAVRSYRRASTPADRSAALLCVAAIVCCCAQAWGDTGAHFKQYNMALGAALALAGKLAISTGAWRNRVVPPPAD